MKRKEEIEAAGSVRLREGLKKRMKELYKTMWFHLGTLGMDALWLLHAGAMVCGWNLWCCICHMLLPDCPHSLPEAGTHFYHFTHLPTMGEALYI